MSVRQCKVCKHNNYGWCKYHSEQIKGIAECDYGVNTANVADTKLRVSKEEVTKLLSNNPEVQAYMMINPVFYYLVNTLITGCDGERLLLAVYNCLQSKE